MAQYSKLFKEFNHNYFMYIPLTIIVQSCLGSVAAMLILMGGHDLFQVVQLFLCIIFCMMYNSSIMAQLNRKIVFNFFLLSIIVNGILIALNFT